MKNQTSLIFIVSLLAVIAIALFFHCKDHCYECSCSNERNLSDEDPSEIRDILDGLNFTFKVDEKDKEQLFYINMEENKSFVVYAKAVSYQNGKIDSFRFTLINAEDSFYVISHVTQPKIDPNDSTKVYIDFCYEKRKCDLPYIPQRYIYKIEDSTKYLKKGDVILHTEEDRNEYHHLDENFSFKSIKVGGHICVVKME